MDLLTRCVWILKRVRVAVTRDQRKLAAIAVTNPHYSIGELAVAKIRDRKILEAIGRNEDAGPFVWCKALEQLNDEAFTFDVLANGAGSIVEQPGWEQRFLPRTRPKTPEQQRRLAVDAKSWRIRQYFFDSLPDAEAQVQSLVGMTGILSNGDRFSFRRLYMIAPCVKRLEREEDLRRVVQDAQDPRVRALAAGWLYFKEHGCPDANALIGNRSHEFNLAVRLAEARASDISKVLSQGIDPAFVHSLLFQGMVWTVDFEKAYGGGGVTP